MHLRFSGSNNPRFGKIVSDETIKKLSDAGKNRHHSSDSKLKISISHFGENNPMYGRTGESHPTWKGGSSFKPYCPKFNREFRERVRAFFGYRCMFPGCGHVWQPGERRLAVHHVNYDRMMCCNDVKPLFVPVCPGGCHAKTNRNRDYYEKIFTEMIMTEFGGNCYIPKKHIERLHRET